MPGEPARPSWPRQHIVGLQRLVLVATAVVPFLASNPGRVSADSRQYLYLEPASFLGRATSLWDATFAAGTVPHQHLGFLWPMGPWFWSADAMGLPTWVAQRLWLAGIAALAGIGMLHLARRTGLGATAAFIGALAYQLTPYQLAFTARFSVLLLPWAALPWLVLLTRRSIVEGSWRAPAAFALVAATAGAANASSLIFVLVAPAIVLGTALLAGEARQAVTAAGRISLLTLGCSAWWLAGLVVQGRYGLPILQLTENVDTVAAASSADDVIRALGNWIFTSTDGTATAIEQAAAYSDTALVRAATVALPAVAVAVLVVARFRGRAAIAAMLGLATAIGVGSAPLSDPSPYGRLWRRFAEENSIGLALRNTPRIVPVVVLATAYALAVGIDLLRGRTRALGAIGATVVVLAAISPVAAHGFLSDDFDRPERIPGYWTALAEDLDADASHSRVLELPGSNFAAYDWGNTVEPVLTGLIDRPTLAREVLPAGGAGTTDLLGALDRRVQHGTLDPRSLAPVARVLGVGDIVIRGDLASERFGLRDPALLVQRFLADPPPGTTVTGRYGGTPDRPLLLRLSVDDPAPRLRAVGGAPVLLAGNGDGIVDAATAGLIDGRGVVLPSVGTEGAAEADALARGATVVVTDTNRKRSSTFFYTITDDVGATESADRRLPDPTGYDVRFGPFANAPVDEQTVARELGGTVTATLDGGPERPEHRAVLAFDGDPLTSWKPRFDPVGQRVEARFDEPVAVDRLSVRTAPGDARITSVAVVLDGRRIDVRLDERARGEGGQPIASPPGPVSVVSVEITGVDGPGQVGIADIGLGGTTIDEVLRLPDGLLRRLADDLPQVPLHYVLTRDRGVVADETRSPVEVDIDRLIEVVAPASFALHGTVGSGPAAQASDRACQDDLVEVDGRPVPVRLEGDALRSCADQRLEAGPHRITTVGDGSMAIDQLVISSSVGEVASPSPVDLQLSADSMRHVAGTVEPPPSPFWLVLSESLNDGWDLGVDGGTVVTATMADGYANGWLIRPDGAGPVQVDVRWTPQRIVWAGMAVSVLTVLGAAIVLVRGRRERPPVVEIAAPIRWKHGGRAMAPAGLLIVAATSFVFAGPAVAALASLAFVVRVAVSGAQQRVVRLGMAGAAFACVGAAEFTDRPSLVFLALGLLLAEVTGDLVAPDHGSTDTSTAAPG